MIFELASLSLSPPLSQYIHSLSLTDLQFVVLPVHYEGSDLLVHEEEDCGKDSEWDGHERSPGGKTIACGNSKE